MYDPVDECLLLADQNWGSALGAARQLGRRGVAVYIANTAEGSHILSASDFCVDAVDVDASDAGEYGRAVVRWAQKSMRLRSSVPVIPLSDRVAHHLDRCRALFSDPFRVAVPATDVVSGLLSKQTSLQLAERAGLDVPPWCAISSESELEPLERLRLPVAVRPASWDSAGKRYFKLAVFHDARSLRSFAQQVRAQGATVIAQEFVASAEGAVEFGLVWRSQDRSRTEVCTGRKRRQSTRQGGVMAWGETCDNPRVRELTEQLLDEAGFTGLGGTEFVRDGNRHWFIEFNPRPEAIHAIAETAGQPQLWLLDQDLRGRPIPQLAPPGRAAAWIGSAWLERLRANPKDVVTYLRDRRLFNEYGSRATAVMSASDPLPSVHLAVHMGLRAGRSVRRHVMQPSRERT